MCIVNRCSYVSSAESANYRQHDSVTSAGDADTKLGRCVCSYDQNAGWVRKRLWYQYLVTTRGSICQFSKQNCLGMLTLLVLNKVFLLLAQCWICFYIWLSDCYFALATFVDGYCTLQHSPPRYNRTQPLMSTSVDISTKRVNAYPGPEYTTRSRILPELLPSISKYK